jgi:hypothetical protein
MVVGHELFHPAQGAPTIHIVRKAAAALGWNEFAKFDVDADVRAAAVDATLSARDAGSVTYQQVLRHFEDSLTFQLRYFAPVFGCPAEKPHKRRRIGSLVLQLGRVVVANRTMAKIDETDFRALTMPTYVVVDSEYRELGIMGLDPLIFLGSFPFDPGELKDFFDKLDSGDVESLVKEAIILNARMGLIEL